MDRLIIRRAAAADKPAVVEFCAKIWEGWDYLPRVWDRWLADPDGAFLVAELDGRPVGTDKITVLSPGEVWLEGLRVDPDHHGRGIALAINRKAMEVVASLKPRTVRFGTVSDNRASRHMGEKDGFRLIFQCRRMVSEKLDGERPPEVAAELTAGPGDLDVIMDYLESSESFRSTRGLFAWGWTFKEMGRDFIGQILTQHGALLLRDGSRIAALALFLPQRHGPRFCLGFIDGGHQEMAELARRFRVVAGLRGAGEVFTIAPEPAVAALSGAGFRQEYPVEVVVYELSGERLKATMEKISRG